LDWIPIALAVTTAVLGVLSALLLKGFAAGKYLQRHEDHRADVEQRFNEFRHEIAELRRCARDEDQARRLVVDRVNTDFGRLELRVAVLERQADMATDFDERQGESRDRRLDHLEALVRELQRQAHQHNRGDDFQR
jgi:chaperonin cofactor prefoldin